MKVIERLNAESIARDEELFLLRVPDREGTHAAQKIDAAATMLFVKMENRFRVAVCAIDVTARFQLVAIIGVIVDLAVVDDLKRAIPVDHRLMPRGDVDDAQAAVAETDIRVNEDPRFVGSAMRDHVAHPLENTG